ncbi:MAG: ComEC/Rec2 family competence protein [Xenococcaceae cyanobacterium]
MNRNSWTILCLAYVIGLLSTEIWGFPNPNPSWQQWTAIATGLGLSSIFAAMVVPRFWRTGPRWRLWLSAGLVALLAAVYFQVRVPQPDVNDISQRFAAVEVNSSSQLVTVEGKVLNQPRLTPSQRVRFWFEAKQLNDAEGKEEAAGSQSVTGKLYVTLPLLQGTGLYPGQKLAVTGILYQPKPASNPGAFDFQAYLARQGAFASLKGLRVIFEDEGQGQPWGLWRLRQRIIRAQVRWLGSPAGPLVSSMVLGRRAVDLPKDIHDQFMQAGLAHMLAASGFHVSLLLGVVLVLLKRFFWLSQLIIGLSTLVLYIGLTGVQPSVMRAGFMGVGVLIGLVMERKVRPLGALLLTATILLLWNPLWIWDLGFGLSFLATLGLIVTVPALQKRLDWLPLAIATVVAIPIAASLWTLPLLMHLFPVVATYSIPVNIVTAPFTALISLGGMISALVALIWPLAGSAIAWLLYYPTHLLIGMVKFFTMLPGSSFAVGRIPLELLLFIYGLIFLVWLSKWWQRRWQLVGLFAVTLVVVFIWYSQLTLVQVTVLAAKGEPVLVIQDRGKVTLVNSGEADTTRYTVLPFLAEQGINKIDCAVALESESSGFSGWSEISASLPVKSFFRHLAVQPVDSEGDWVEAPQGEYQPLSMDETVSVGSTAIKLISAEPPVLQLQILDLTWFLLASSQPVKGNEVAIPEYLQEQESNFTPQVLLWSGRSLRTEWLEALEPMVAIASSSTVEKNTRQQLQEKQIQLYWTGRDGAIQWTPKGGFQTTLEAADKDVSLM